MPIVTPRTWVAGDVLTAAQMNVDVRDNVSFLANPPSCRVTHSTTQSMANSANTVVVFNTERYDTDAMHSTASNTSRITINTAGLYLVSFCGELASAADYVIVGAYLQLNGTTPIAVGQKESSAAAGTTAPWVSVSTVYKFAATNYVEALVTQSNNAAAARNLIATANYTPEFSATWIGLG